jgi:CheY-like chemotaxis protein
VPKILIADDNSNVQKTVALVFEERGVQVISVGNGEAAVRRMPTLDPDLVLADIFMPVRNGYEVCEFVKKDERFSHIPVILLVGAFDPLDEKEARRVGADGILKKPFVPPDALIAMVMSALEKSPRAAAELAKAKEVKEAPEPDPLPQLEVPARKEPKPLPYFPEPSPEEATLAYGFGSEKKQGSSEPVALAGGPPDEGDEFDDAADWRRGARDFEIPAEAANSPAFSSDDDWEPSAPSSGLDSAADVVALPESDRATPVPFKANVPSELESTADDFFEPEPAFMPPSAQPDAPKLGFGQPLTASVSDEALSSEPQSQDKRDALAQNAHWMDAVATSASQQPQRDWMSALSEQQEKSAPADTVERSTASEADSDSLEARPESVESLDSDAGSTGEQPFFADEPEPSKTAQNLFVNESPALETSKELEAEPFASEGFPAPQFFPSEDHRASTDTVLFKDPALVEPPAVRVTPEPLLVDDEPRQSPQYGSHVEEIPPAHSFFVPEVDQKIAEESPAHNAADELIPTGPPPSLDALADIPFLVPPPGFRPDASEESAADSETVEAVVQKVLEKLEPQLHELLSQGVLRPLVERLLQSELAKKEK